MDDRTFIFVNKKHVPNASVGELRSEFDYLGDLGLEDASNANKPVFFFLEKPGELEEFVRDLQPKNVFVVGGDILQNEAVGLAVEYDFTLGVMPHGSTNNHAAAIGFPNNLQKILKKTAATREGAIDRSSKLNRYLRPFRTTVIGKEYAVRKVDIGVLSINGGKDHYFANNIGTGLVPANNFRAMITRKEGDQEEEFEDINLDLLIGQYMNDHLHINPNGKVTDGEAEIVMYNNRNESSLARFVNGIINGKGHVNPKHVDYRRGVHELTAVFQNPQVIQYDGITHPEKAKIICAKILPEAISMVTKL